MVIFRLVRKLLFVWESVAQKNDRGISMLLLNLVRGKNIFLLNFSKNAHLQKHFKNWISTAKAILKNAPVCTKKSPRDN